MKHSLEEIAKAVGCKKYPARWQLLFEEAMAEYAQTGNPLADPAYYDRLQEKYGCMADYLELYKEAARQTATVEALSRFLFLLAFALRDEENRGGDIGGLALLEAPEGQDPLAYNMVTGLAVCSQLDEANEKLTARDFPEEFRRGCLRSAVSCGVNSYKRLHGGQPGYRLLGWAQRYLAGKLCMIGRLEAEFECAFKGHGTVFQRFDGQQLALAKNITLHRSGFALGSRHYEDPEGSWEPVLEETEASVTGYPYLEDGSVSRQPVTLLREEWKPVLTEGDPVIGLHIPERPGQPLSPEVVDSTLEQIKTAAAARGYAYKGFTCQSWLMDPQVVEMAGSKSNLAQFSARFGKMTVKSSGENVFVFVYKQPNADFALENLPEYTRLERGIKQHYLAGKAIYDVFGYFLKSDRIRNRKNVPQSK